MFFSTITEGIILHFNFKQMFRGCRESNSQSYKEGENLFSTNGIKLNNEETLILLELIHFCWPICIILLLIIAIKSKAGT